MAKHKRESKADKAYRLMVEAVRNWLSIEHPKAKLITVSSWDCRGGGEDLASFHAYFSQFSRGDARAAGLSEASNLEYRDLFAY